MICTYTFLSLTFCPVSIFLQLVQQLTAVYREYLHLSYEHYIASLTPGTRLQYLFVPGLEPIHIPAPTQIKLKDEGPPFWPWYASQMHAKDGVEIERKGVRVGHWVDGRKWERVLWKVGLEEEANRGMGTMGIKEREDTPGL